MSKSIIEKLANNGIFSYESAEAIKLEKQMEKYFTREYKRWEGGQGTPEDYGVSSFEGEIARQDTHDVSVSHYDEEYRVYCAFLDKKYMAYTMGYFCTGEDQSYIENISLEDAQKNKYALLAERADIKDGQAVLDLGCGFGGFSKYLLETYPNIKVTGINPSVVQTDHIKNVLMTENKYFDSSRFTLIQGFFDELYIENIKENNFDRVVSMGLLEHITNIDLFQEKVSRVLKQGGKCLHHCIVSYDLIPAYLNSENSMMGDYYPGAHIWPYKEPARHNKYLKFKKSWFLNGMNYWKTLDEWHKTFWKEISHLHPEHISVDEVDKWNKYFILCKTMFSPNNGYSYGNGHYLFVND